MKTKGSVRLDTIVTALVFMILLGFWFWSFNQEKIAGRDAQRLSDIRQIETAFVLLFRDYDSYASALCQEDDLASQCRLEEYLPDIASFQDPGNFQYKVQQAPDQKTYAVSFTLEKSYQNLKAGTHILNEKGIQ